MNPRLTLTLYIKIQQHRITIGLQCQYWSLLALSMSFIKVLDHIEFTNNK